MSQQCILAFSGKKQSGKDSTCMFLLDNVAQLFGVHTEHVGFEEPLEFGGMRRGSRAVTTPPGAGLFSMAGPLKKVCVEVMGLRPEQVYGTDAEKNSLTRYRWEDLPHYTNICLDVWEAAWKKCVRPKPLEDGSTHDNPTVEELAAARAEAVANTTKGLMTGRQVLQEVGTGIFRRMYANVWNDACIRDIRKSGVEYAFINDVRFPDEVAAVQAAGGKVVRFTRDPYAGTDQHASEKALDPDVYDWSKFDAVVDNRDMTVEQQQAAVQSWLYRWGWTETGEPLADDNDYLLQMAYTA